MKKPGVGLAVILMRDKNLVLLGKRKGSHGKGMWAFPGGHLEKYETFKDCAVREMKEETGLVLDEHYDLIDEYPGVATNDFFKEDDKHYVTLFLRADYIEGKLNVMEPDKCEEWRWFEWDLLKNRYESAFFKFFVSVNNLMKRGYNPFLK